MESNFSNLSRECFRLEEQDRILKIKNVIDNKMNVATKENLKQLVLLLHDITIHSFENKMTSDNLAIIFFPVLFPTNSILNEDKLGITGKTIIKDLIDFPHNIFTTSSKEIKCCLLFIDEYIYKQPSSVLSYSNLTNLGLSESDAKNKYASEMGLDYYSSF